MEQAMDDNLTIAHKSENGDRVQLLREHLENVADLASGFAEVFGAGALARCIGKSHDIGKYSDEFQQRIRGKSISVDHSTAGAQMIVGLDKTMLGKLAAYCIMGHHAGLPDGGSESDVYGMVNTFWARLKNPVPDYQGYSSDIQIEKLTPPRFTPTEGDEGFSLAFFTRMLYSCLVDADWLDTESFMRDGKIDRSGFKSLSELKLNLDKHLENFRAPSTDLNIERTELLNACLTAAEKEGGLFTLTAPTGSGKTLSSMAFSLTHAIKHEKSHILYIVPYNTIIEQNAEVFEQIFGSDNVVQHHSGTNYDNDEGSPDYRKLLATENWDAPIIMTSSVRLFESLFGNQSSVCRKLHNIANSVIVLDEAQMIPLPHLLPCVKAIRELVLHYGCTAVLATATQPSLNKYFKPLEPIEIASDPLRLYELFRRVTYRKLPEPITENDLVEQLQLHSQALCIVNSRQRAQDIAGLLGEDGLHLSTTMCPAHRSAVLDEIRLRLKMGDPCLVVSTSLIEAGVDVDFPVLYREKAGLDSIIQAAGRCNREGHRSKESSYANIFTIADSQIRHIAQNVGAYEQIARQYDDIASLEAIGAYFEQLRYIIGEDGLDKNSAVQEFNAGRSSCSFKFKSISKKFKLIEDSTKGIIIPYNEEADKLIERLRWGERSRSLFRAIQRYSVSLYEGDLKRQHELGTVAKLDSDGEFLVYAVGYYDKRCGVPLSPQGGMGLFV
jgi:CRISPR-associated endonuclease/helicase Cas3